MNVKIIDAVTRSGAPSLGLRNKSSSPATVPSLKR
jgi:hypothetical protein